MPGLRTSATITEEIRRTGRQLENFNRRTKQVLRMTKHNTVVLDPRTFRFALLIYWPVTISKMTHLPEDCPSVSETNPCLLDKIAPLHFHPKTVIMIVVIIERWLCSPSDLFSFLSWSERGVWLGRGVCAGRCSREVSPQNYQQLIAQAIPPLVRFG